jgi:hypothetical protein
MFGIANAIAYAGLMVSAKTPGQSPIRDVLGPSAWIHLEGAPEDKWCEDEGALVVALLRQLAAAGVKPDLYIVTPFVIVAERLRRLVRESGVATGWAPDGASRDWPSERIGTVHTAQGREAEAVILVLGAPSPAQAGARNWAGGRPNLLNVAVTRAKEVLYVVGNRRLWREAGVFRELDARFSQVERTEEEQKSEEKRRHGGTECQRLEQGVNVPPLDNTQSVTDLDASCSGAEPPLTPDAAQKLFKELFPDFADILAQPNGRKVWQHTQGRPKRDTEAAQQERQESADRARAERMEQWKRSGMPQEWVLEHLDGWDHPAWMSLWSRMKSTPYWPLRADEVVAYLEGLRDELRGERQGQREAERQLVEECPRQDIEGKRQERERQEREAGAAVDIHMDSLNWREPIFAAVGSPEGVLVTPATWEEFVAEGWLVRLDAQVEDEKDRPGYLRVWLRRKPYRGGVPAYPPQARPGSSTEVPAASPPEEEGEECEPYPHKPKWSLPATPDDTSPTWHNIVRAYEEFWE